MSSDLDKNDILKFVREQGGAPQNNAGGSPVGTLPDEFMEAFSDILGGLRPGGWSGGDLLVAVTISFVDSWRGCRRTVDAVRVPMPCGAKACRGGGTIPNQRCADCDGSGWVSQDRSFSVTVPAGVAHGTRLRLRGQGVPPAEPGGEVGDLYVLVKVEPHERYRRADLDLLVEHAVSSERARRGGRVAVPLPEGEHTVMLEPGIENGHETVVEGQGFVDAQTGTRGDLRIIYRVTKRSLWSRLFGGGRTRE